MSAPRDFRDFISDMVEACRAIIEFVAGMTLDSYLADRRTRYAVMRGFAHGYFGIDDAILFTTISDELEPLLPRLERLMQEHGGGS